MAWIAGAGSSPVPTRKRKVTSHNPIFYECVSCGKEQEANEEDAQNWHICGRCPHCPKVTSHSPIFYECVSCGKEQEANEEDAQNWQICGRCPHCPPASQFWTGRWSQFNPSSVRQQVQARIALRPGHDLEADRSRAGSIPAPSMRVRGKPSPGHAGANANGSGPLLRECTDEQLVAELTRRRQLQGDARGSDDASTPPSSALATPMALGLFQAEKHLHRAIEAAQRTMSPAERLAHRSALYAGWASLSAAFSVQLQSL
eukprot:SAG31_NODE_254_length_19052_cov_8.982114_4_plen_259_part_00